MGDKACARCGVVPVIEDGLCQDCLELVDNLEDYYFDDEDDFEDHNDEEDDYLFEDEEAETP